MSEPKSDRDTFGEPVYMRSCGRCHVRRMWSVRPWWPDLRYVCNECGDQQRRAAAQ